MPEHRRVSVAVSLGWMIGRPAEDRLLEARELGDDIVGGGGRRVVS